MQIESALNARAGRFRKALIVSSSTERGPWGPNRGDQGDGDVGVSDSVSPPWIHDMTPSPI